MATINYCDWDTGDDSTGDGSSGNPYKTIQKASTGVTGGDEVRVGKSPADTALTGTLGFTRKSTAVTGVGTAFTTELAVGDFVKGGDDEYYEVLTLTSDTALVLWKNYIHATESGVTSAKLGVIDTGEASSTSTLIQSVESSGTSDASRLKISGGWDLATETQDGQSYFRQIHSTITRRYGRGLTIQSKSFLELERLHFTRNDNCIYMSASDDNKLTGMKLLSGNDENLYATNCDRNEFISMVLMHSQDKGLYLLSGSKENIITDLLAGGCTYGVYTHSSVINQFIDPVCLCNIYGFQISTDSSNNRFIRPNCDYNTYGMFVSGSAEQYIEEPLFENNTVGAYIDDSLNQVVVSPTVNNNSNTGFIVTSSMGTIINNFAGTGNPRDLAVYAGQSFSEHPMIRAQHFKTTGDNRCYYEYGITYRDTTDARSTQCLKFDPTSDTYYIMQSFFFKADSGVAQTLSAYIKDDASFNGDVQAGIFFMGAKITGWTEWATTTSYAQKSIVADAGDITEDGVLELRVKVRGTAGNAFIDDLNAV